MARPLTGWKRSPTNNTVRHEPANLSVQNSFDDREDTSSTSLLVPAQNA